MRYGYFRDHGMFVGSGVVEAGCKAIIGQRLKLSGMRWNIPGATGILTLRCQHASGRWDQIWQAAQPDRRRHGLTSRESRSKSITYKYVAHPKRAAIGVLRIDVQCLAAERVQVSDRRLEQRGPPTPARGMTRTARAPRPSSRLLAQPNLNCSRVSAIAFPRFGGIAQHGRRPTSAKRSAAAERLALNGALSMATVDGGRAPTGQLLRDQPAERVPDDRGLLLAVCDIAVRGSDR